jgi:hypothetical protein
VPKENDNPRTVASPSATGNAGAGFEAKVGAFYLLALLTSGEPRCLPNAVARSIQFQGAVDDRPFDDVIVSALNTDGSSAILEVQAKRTIDFTASNPEYRDAVRRLWAAAQKPEFGSSRYEMAVAIARTSTHIERSCQEVLHWARKHSDAASFERHLGISGYASDGMRRFVQAFRHQLDSTGAPNDINTVWGLLRRFSILAFDFEAPGSGWENMARERARLALDPSHADRAYDLWMLRPAASTSPSQAIAL